MDYWQQNLMINLTKWIFLDQKWFDGMKISVVRDDIFPFIGGGSKARKAVYYEQFLKEKGYNAVVTCGGIQSNHNRAIALMATSNGWRCHLCIQGEEQRFFKEKGNALLDILSGAECELIHPNDTAQAMDRAMDRFRDQGYNPYYIHGGGHDLPGGVAFVEAVESLKSECERIDFKPDYIFHASGTGSTQAGILVGLDRVGWSDIKVIGISVARQYDRGKKVIEEFTRELADYYGMSQTYNERVLFSTDYLFGGYECFPKENESYLNNATKATGLVFDTTYSGKAFYGMMDIIKKEGLQNKNVLFWHTGGIMNIMR